MDTHFLIEVCCHTLHQQCASIKKNQDFLEPEKQDGA
jgi:hypothetical protein